jgi:hypothetical protein
MADKVANALGAPEVAGTLVNPKGLVKKAVGKAAGSEVAGFVGAAAAGLAQRERRGETPDLPEFGRHGYVAVSETEIALLKTKFGWKMTPTEEVLARVPRSELSSVDFDEGRNTSHLTLSFSDGRKWEFDVARTERKTAKAVAAALQS